MGAKHPSRWSRSFARPLCEAAERTILTAISDGAQPAALADLLLAAETDRECSAAGEGDIN
jgi:hypothetical protein